MSLDLDPIRKGADKYEQALCPLPECGQPLHMVWQVDTALYLSFTAADLAEPDGDYSWEVICEAGHKVLLPIDSAADNYQFGRCTCEPGDDPASRWCEHDDMRRLRNVARRYPSTPNGKGEWPLSHSCIPY